MANNEYTSPEYARAYLAAADSIPHRHEGESVLLSFVPRTCKRILDLGTGDGRLIGMLLDHCPDSKLIGLDLSPTMVETARARFADNGNVSIQQHDLDIPISCGQEFDAIVSSFAIHHCADHRKQSLYGEIFSLLKAGGVFLNLEHVASPTEGLHLKFLDELGSSPGDEDPSNILLDVHTQTEWLREIGFADVDCYWKWLELALFGGSKPAPLVG